MKTLLKWLNNSVVLGVLLIAGLVTDLILVGRAYDLSKSDWGTWLGSIGTVATLAGTIWLATSTERRRQREELGRAMVAAARMAVRLPVIQASFSTVRSFCTHAVFEADPSRDYAAAAQQMQQAGTWENADVDPLIHIAGDRVALLEMTRSRLEVAYRYLLTLSTSHRLDPSKTSEAYIQIDALLTSIENELTQHTEALQAFLIKHGLPTLGD
jgi:hypothetical protein